MALEYSDSSDNSDHSEVTQDFFVYDVKKNITLGDHKPVRDIEGLTADSAMNVAFEGHYPQPIYDGAPVWSDFDMDSKGLFPWREGIVDPSDYFNYGFTEGIWKYYTAKQVQIRAELKMAGLQTNAYDQRKGQERKQRPMNWDRSQQRQQSRFN